jgi:hypothetical protein
VPPPTATAWRPKQTGTTRTPEKATKRKQLGDFSASRLLRVRLIYLLAKFPRQRKPNRCNNFRAARLAKMATAVKPVVSSLGSAEAGYILFKAA